MPLGTFSRNATQMCMTYVFRYGEADPNELNSDNCSPLQMACAMLPQLKGQAEIIDMLLTYNANPRYSSGSYSYR